jgi:predicted  nucleic acid-binding Zn-ribbon protein
MSVTSKLLRVYQVDKQIRGLRSRLNAAEKFLSEQDKQLKAISEKKILVESQLKHLTATVKNIEGEMARLDARMEAIKTQMNSAQTNKEYKAFLTEHGTHKAERDRHETTALEHMAKLDEMKKQIADLDTQHDERERMRGVAASDRAAREVEIKDRLNELTAQRKIAVGEVPAEALTIFERLLDQRGEEAMASVEEQDRKRLEYNCGSCMMSITVESINGLVSGGKLTRCSSCGCILFMEKEIAEAFAPATSKR